MADDRPFGTLPVVDVAPLRSTQAAGSAEVARQIEAACREHGFFYVTGHGVAPDLLARLTRACAAFFALPQAAKMEIAMARGGPAWRGYFPVGAELTSGRPDLKEGLYFGAELGRDDPRVRAGLPLHGPNLFPRQVPELRAAVLDYIGVLTDLGQTVLRGVALSLGLDADYLVPVDAAPGPQRQRPGPVLLPVLLRPRLHRRDPAAAGAGRDRRQRPAALERAGPAGASRHLRRLPDGQGLQGVPAAPPRGTDRRGP